MMEAAVRVAGGEDGRTDEDEGKEGLSLDFGYASSHRYHLQHDKLLRSDVFPFRIALSSPATDAATASDGRAAGSPPSARGTFASPPNSGIGVGTTVISTHGGSPDSYGTPRALRPLVPPFNSPGLGGDATLLLCSPFTAAQWQELHRQALIYKCIMASTPVPPELLFSPRPFPDGPPLYSNLGRGGDYLNLRFTSARGDREPGRCRRTDGKKWRCSRDVAPGQKYCERHVHRARPRSRKPVEPDGRAGPVAAANAAEAVSTTPRGMSHGTLTTTDGPSSAAARPPCTESSPGVLPGDPDVKFPFQFMVPQDKKLRTLGSSGRGGAEVQAATQQWELLHSKMGTSDLQQRRQQYEDDQLNLNWNHGCPFASADISSLEDLPEPHDQRDTPRRFIDAWSRPENPLHGVTIRDNHKSTNSGDGGSSLRSLGNLSPSNLTLSMSGTGGGEDQDHFPVGLRAAVADSGRMLAPSWMSPSSPIGGPLAEVLQTSSTASFRTGRPGGENDGAGLIDLMNKASCESSEGTSPRDGKVRGFSSPTRVLQKAFVSLSDSSSNSSPTLRPGLGPDSGLQWASPSN